MASLDDVVSNLKNVVTNLGTLANAIGAPGLTAEGVVSPIATLQTALGTTALSVVPFNASRRAIAFFNCDANSTATMWVTPLPVLTIGQGVPILPGAMYAIDASLGCNCGWTAIAATGPNSMLILEFV